MKNFKDILEAAKMKGKDPCWKDYEMVGMKDKGGKKVPNCVPEEVQQEGAVPANEKIITVKHKTSGKTLRISAAAAAKYRMQGYHYHPVNEAKDEQEYGYEGDMALNQLATLTRCADMIKELLKPDTDMPEWVQSKITLATDYIQTAADYMYSEMKESVEQIDEVSLKTATSAYVKRVGRDETGADPKAAKTIQHIANKHGVVGVARAAKAADKEYGLNDPVHNKRKDFVKGVMSGVKTEEVEHLNEDDGLKSIAKKHGMEYHPGTYGANMSHAKKGFVNINRYGEWSHHKQGRFDRGHGPATAHGDSSQNFKDLDKHLSSLKEEVEPIEELSNATLRGYADKARADIQKTLPKLHTDAKAAGRIDKRISGLASSTIAKVKNNMKKEDVEQLDEISDKLAGDYLKKVNDKLIKKVGMKPDLYNHLEPKRQKGATRALNRLMKPVEEGTSADSDGGPPTPAASTLTVTGQPKLTKTIGQTKMIPFVHEDTESDKKGSWKVETPWRKIKGDGTVTDKSGAKHTPMSRARDLARQAFKRKVEEQSNVQPNPFTIPAIDIGKAPKKPKEASPVAPTAMAESRQLEIVREAMRVSKKKKEEKVTEAGSDKFIADPELSSQITKSNP
jgi:hypothetical protein